MGLNEIISQCSQHPDPMTLPHLSRLCRSTSWEARSKGLPVPGRQGVGNKIHLLGAWITGPTPVREQRGWGGKLNSEAAAALTRSSEAGLAAWRGPGQEQGTGLCVTVDQCLGPQGRTCRPGPPASLAEADGGMGGSCGGKGEEVEA